MNAMRTFWETHGTGLEHLEMRWFLPILLSYECAILLPQDINHTVYRQIYTKRHLAIFAINGNNPVNGPAQQKRHCVMATMCISLIYLQHVIYVFVQQHTMVQARFRQWNQPMRQQWNQPIRRQWNQLIRRQWNQPIRRQWNQPIRRQWTQPIRRQWIQPMRRQWIQPIRRQWNQPIRRQWNQPTRRQWIQPIRWQWIQPIRRQWNQPIRGQINQPVQ